MSKNTINFGDKSVEKRDLYKEDTKLFKIEDIDVNEIKVSMKKIYSRKNKSYKHYIGYNDNSEIIPLIIMLP